RAVADFGDEVDAEIEADHHRFVVPDGCHWADVRNRTARSATSCASTASHPPASCSTVPTPTSRRTTDPLELGLTGAARADPPRPFTHFEGEIMNVGELLERLSGVDR